MAVHYLKNPINHIQEANQIISVDTNQNILKLNRWSQGVLTKIFSDLRPQNGSLQKAKEVPIFVGLIQWWRQLQKLPRVSPY